MELRRSDRHDSLRLASDDPVRSLRNLICEVGAQLWKQIALPAYPSRWRIIESGPKNSWRSEGLTILCPRRTPGGGATSLCKMVRCCRSLEFLADRSLRQLQQQASQELRVLSSVCSRNSTVAQGWCAATISHFRRT